ncbi:MAG TPA: class I SAM-dependent methyltransferase [Rhizomicrobium sp.]|jgi:SAM-dependent methyltransferase
MDAVGKYSVAEQVNFDGLEMYDGLRVHGAPGVHAAILKKVRQLLPPPAKVLDLACGQGALAKRFIDAGYSMTCCDLIDDKCKIKDEAEFVQANLNEDFAGRFSELFDCVIASEIIEHLENPRHFLREINALLRPGGLLLITTPNVDSPFSKAVFLRAGYHQGFSPYDYTESGHITPMSLSDIRRAVTESGFLLNDKSSAGGQPGSRGWWKMRALAAIISPMCDASVREQCLMVTALKSLE